MATPPTDHPDRPTTRLEAEILEILERVDRPPTTADKVRAKVRTEPSHAWQELRAKASKHRFSLTPGMWLVGAIGFAALAYLAGHGSPLLARIFAISSLACLVIPIVSSLRHPRAAGIKKWRGKEIDPRGDQPQWVSSLRDHFKKPPRRP